MKPAVAILIPCHNEERSIARVVAAFRAVAPDAAIYVYDNRSTDATSREARDAGAIVRSEPDKGKGNVVRRMFADVSADVYVLVDGDGTYDAASLPRLVETLLTDRLDVVIGARVPASDGAYRRGHKLGNWLLTRCVRHVFGGRFGDMLSGYRVMSRRFVKSFPALSRGFEIETELTVHALELRVSCAELPTPYRERPAGSASKLRTYRDGFRILGTIVHLIKEEKPLEFFFVVSLAFAALAIGLGVPIFVTYYQTHLVPRFPTAVLCASLVVLACLSLVCGLVLETVTRARQEAKRLWYLMYAPVGSAAEQNVQVEPQRARAIRR